MSLSIKFGNFLYKNAFVLYRPLYTLFKNKQDGFEITLLKKHVRQNDVVLDIGANIGYYAVMLSKLTGIGGKVHCFEPDATNFKYLVKSCAGQSNIVLNHAAVGPRTEKIKIYTSKNLNVDHRTYKPEEYDREIEVDAVSMDHYLDNNFKVDLIKMDIQGFEMQAVQGMKKTLAANPGIKIISEFWPYGLKKAGSSVTDYFDFLRQQGFHVWILENNSLKKLSTEKVKSLETLGETHYFNIFASRSDV